MADLFIFTRRDSVQNLHDDYKFEMNTPEFIENNIEILGKYNMENMPEQKSNFSRRKLRSIQLCLILAHPFILIIMVNGSINDIFDYY